MTILFLVIVIKKIKGENMINEGHLLIDKLTKKIEKELKENINYKKEITVNYDKFEGTDYLKVMIDGEKIVTRSHNFTRPNRKTKTVELIVTHLEKYKNLWDKIIQSHLSFWIEIAENDEMDVLTTTLKIEEKTKNKFGFLVTDQMNNQILNKILGYQHLKENKTYKILNKNLLRLEKFVEKLTKVMEIETGKIQSLTYHIEENKMHLKLYGYYSEVLIKLEDGKFVLEETKTQINFTNIETYIPKLLKKTIEKQRLKSIMNPPNHNLYNYLNNFIEFNSKIYKEIHFTLLTKYEPFVLEDKCVDLYKKYKQNPEKEKIIRSYLLSNDRIKIQTNGFITMFKILDWVFVIEKDVIKKYDLHEIKMAKQYVENKIKRYMTEDIKTF